MKIFAIDKDGNREEITDLFWFEETSVHDFNGEGAYGPYRYEFELEPGDIVITEKNDPHN